MTDDPLFILVYGLSTLVCFLVAAALLLLKQLRSVRNRKYRNACRFLALASAFVGVSSLLTLLVGDSSLATFGLLAFPVILVASSQSLLFTFLLILLFRERYVTRRTILLHASPSIVLTVLYLVALCFTNDPAVFSFRQWSEQINNPVLLIRTLYAGVYVVQLIVYTRIFFRQRALYGESLEQLGQVPERLELRWVTRVFLYALTVGLCALSLCFILSTVYEMALTALFTVFYLLTGFYYANYQFTYDFMREELFKTNAPLMTEEPEEPADLGTLVDELTETKIQEMNRKLFEEAELLMTGTKPFLNPAFNRQELVKCLFTNEHYLTRALRQHTGKSIQDYLTYQRYKYARILLENPDNPHSIEQIATDSGFSSVRTFNRSFKKLNPDDMPPSEFRKRHQ